MSNEYANGILSQVDFREELTEFEWIRPRWSSDKLIAASPFRYDNTPSFFCSLTHGGWKDSGAYDADFESGGFVKLLSFLRSETEEETEEYLRLKYGVIPEKDSFRIAPPALKKLRKRIVLPEETISEYTKRHSYLGKVRKISPKTEAFFSTRYSPESNAIIIPWRHPDGKLANVKFRKVRGKAFWYAKGAHPIRDLVWGLDAIHSLEGRLDVREVYVCEAEIDAMSVWSLGKPAIALGGASISKSQIDAIKRAPIETIVIATDNDKAGDKLAEQLSNHFREYRLKRLAMPKDLKDVNEALVKGEFTPETFRNPPLLPVQSELLGNGITLRQ